MGSSGIIGQAIIFFLLAMSVYLVYRLQAVRKKFQQEKINTKTQKLRVQAMLESIGDGVVATDKDGAIIFMNKVAEEVLSWTPDMLGKKLGDLSLLADANGSHVLVENHPLHRCIVSRQKVITQDYHFVRAGSFDLAVYISATPIILNGEVVGAIEVFRDITKEKAIDKTKSEFVFLASHQLKTPLATINWCLELLLAQDGGPITENQKAYLNEAYLSARHMVDLVNEILDVSRLELGTLITKIEPVNLPAILEEELSEVMPLVVDKKITLNKEISKDFPIINADIKHLRMILLNLLTNAIKYTPENGLVTIKVSNDASKYYITVIDNGYGIPKAEQSKIFSKLFRANNVKKREPNGTGLGLYAVKSVVDQLKGTINFASKENKGTTFNVSLPLS